jgi:serine/threonine protein kinase
MDDETLPLDPKSLISRTAIGGTSSNGRPSGTVLGQYRLVRKIAAGGMGEVYEAIQLNLDRRVALKLVAEHFAADPVFLQRFEREAKAAALINHPNIVQVYDFGCVNDQYYLAMEYVDGKDLAEIVHERGKLDVAEALSIVEQTALALEAALQQHIIHRDIKPSNLLLTNKGVVKVSDLGLAKRLDEISDVTLTGTGMGSPHFLSPEQASDASTVDHRGDIYALGITLLYLLTGRRPFDRSSALSIALAHVQEPLPSGLELGTSLPPGMESLISRMAAKNPAERYQDYAELLQDIARVKQGLGPKVQYAFGRKTGSRTLWISAAALFLLLLAGAAFLYRGKGTNRDLNSRSDVPQDNPSQKPPGRDLGPEGDRRGPPPWERDREFEGGPRELGAFPLPMPRPDPPERNAIPEGPVPVALAAAKDYARTNKTAYRPIVDRYHEVLDRAQGTPWEDEVQKDLDSALAALSSASAAAISEYKERMLNLVKQNRPQQAYEIWRTFPGSLRTREVDRQIEAELSAALPPDFRPAFRPN